jgi:hypothetical protein
MNSLLHLSWLQLLCTNHTENSVLLLLLSCPLQRGCFYRAVAQKRSLLIHLSRGRYIATAVHGTVLSIIRLYRQLQTLRQSASANVVDKRGNYFLFLPERVALTREAADTKSGGPARGKVSMPWHSLLSELYNYHNGKRHDPQLLLRKQASGRITKYLWISGRKKARAAFVCPYRTYVPIRDLVQKGILLANGNQSSLFEKKKA